MEEQVDDRVDICCQTNECLFENIYKNLDSSKTNIVQNQKNTPFKQNTIVLHKKLPELVPAGLCSGQGIFVDLKKEINKRVFGKKEDPLIKSIGKNKHVVDGTGGFGVDAAYIFFQNKTISCFEKDNLVCLFLKMNFFYLNKGFDNKKIKIENNDVFKSPGCKKSVLYLDPMFPDKKKKALPIKRIQWLRHHLADSTVDVISFLKFGQSRFKKVVLKRPSRGAVWGKPSGSVLTKSVRYDIYPGV